MASEAVLNYLMFNNEEWCSNIVDNIKYLQSQDKFLAEKIKYLEYDPLEKSQNKDDEYELSFGLLHHKGKVIVPKCHVKAVIEATHLMFNSYQEYHIDALKIKKQISKYLHIYDINEEIKKVLNACYCTKTKRIRF